MKTQLRGVLAGTAVLCLLTVTVAACGDANKTRAGTPVASTAVVTTLAGKAGSRGSADGSGAAARFNHPDGIACDAAGNLYVADTANFTIRKITPAGKVTTIAGKAHAYSFDSADGRGAAARFQGPCGIACDATGNLYVTDTFNQTIRKITPTDTVSTLAGKVGSYGSTDGMGAAARFFNPTGIVRGSSIPIHAAAR